MKKTFCDQCKDEIPYGMTPRVFDIEGGTGQGYSQGIHHRLELCSKCYGGWVAVIKYVMTLDGLKDCLNRSRGL